MTYEETLEKLFALRRFGVRPGLGATRRALKALGDPQDAFPAIHIAGSNGKGSTAAVVDSVLRARGLKTGLYTSPHLARFTERIRISGVELPKDEAGVLFEAAQAAGPELTFFELVTVMAFLQLARSKVDIAVVEVGLGGRLDATNVLGRPLVSCITGIALEHTEILGDTLDAIAREKAGILRSGVPGVIGLVPDEARLAIEEVAAQVGAPTRWLGVDFDEVDNPALLGPHQRRNAAVALEAVRLLPVPLQPSDAAMRQGLAEARWPGRLEPLAHDLVVDGAHNADGAVALAASLPALAHGRPIHLVLGAVDDKDVLGLFAPLSHLASRVIATTVPNPRGRPAAALAELLSAVRSRVDVVPDPHKAVASAREPGTLTVVAGSLFLVGAVRARLLGEPIDPIAAQDPSVRNPGR